MGKPILLAMMTLGLASPALARPYGEELLARALHANPGVAAVTLHVRLKDGTDYAVVSDAPAAAGRHVTVPINAATGDAIGSADVTLRRHADTAKLAAYLARRIYTADSLRDEDPIVPGTPDAPFAAQLIEDSLRDYPTLITIAFHVAPSGAPTNVIIASNFGRRGKPGDDDDLKVITQGAVLKEVTNGGRRLAVELPMLDRSGRVIGALSTSFTIGGAADQPAAADLAVKLRDRLARRIMAVTELFDAH